MRKVTSHADTILYILRMHFVHQTTLCPPSSNMHILSCLLLQHAFSQARPSVKLACSEASIELAPLLCYLYQAGLMLCISHQYDSMMRIKVAGNSFININ